MLGKGATGRPRASERRLHHGGLGVASHSVCNNCTDSEGKKQSRYDDISESVGMAVGSYHRGLVHSIFEMLELADEHSSKKT